MKEFQKVIIIILSKSKLIVTDIIMKNFKSITRFNYGTLQYVMGQRKLELF